MINYLEFNRLILHVLEDIKYNISYTNSFSVRHSYSYSTEGDLVILFFKERNPSCYVPFRYNDINIVCELE